MTDDECIKILTEHNLWRRGKPPYQNGGEKTSYTVKQLGEALDHAIDRLKGLEK